MKIVIPRKRNSLTILVISSSRCCGESGALVDPLQHLPVPLPQELRGPAQAQGAEDQARQDVASQVVHVLGGQVRHLSGKEHTLQIFCMKQALHGALELRSQLATTNALCSRIQADKKYLANCVF